jgi:uncharacterized protein
MGRLNLRHHDDVEDFLAAAGSFLEAREAEHNLILGVCTNIRRYPDVVADNPPVFLTVTASDGRPVAASFRMPPFNQVLSEIDDADAVDLLADWLADAGHQLPGVLGPKVAARGFVERWRERTGTRSELTIAERIFRLATVVPPRAATGAWRIAEEGDRTLIRDWYQAFVDEAAPNDPPPDDVDAIIDRLVRRIGRTIYLWEDAGRPVCLVGAGGETPHGTRIGPVYTPPEFRGRGYASNLTAAVSQEQLDAGRRFCFLFTDLANPTSNRIYQAIGYEAVTDVDQYRFLAS